MKGMNNFNSPRLVAAALAALLAVAGARLMAQEAASGPAATAPTSVPATMPAATEPSATQPAATQPTTTQPAAIAPATSQPVARASGKPLQLNFKDVPLRTVVEYLSEAAGFVVIQSDKLDGRITLISRQPVPAEQAIDLLDTALREKGFAAIRNGRVLKIVTLDQAKKEMIPVRSGSDPKRIEASDKIITQIIPLRTVDAVKLKADLASLIPSSTDVTSNAASNSLIVTGSEAIVRKIAEIIAAVDAPSDVAKVQVFQLKYANATAAAKLVMDIFKDDQGGGGGQGQQGGFGRGGRGQFVFSSMGPGGPGGGEDATSSKKTVKVQASADDRTNTLVVSASPDMLKVVEQVVEELDKNPVQAQAVFIYRLKNAQASTLEGVLNNLFGTGSGSGSSSGFGQASRNTGGNFGSGLGNTGSRSGSRSGGSGLGSGGTSMRGLSSGTGTVGSSRGSGTTGGRTGGSNPLAGGRGVSAQSAAAANDLLGQVYVVADQYTNSLLVTTSSANFERVKGIISDLDRPVPQVLIKVLIAEVSHDNALDLGVEFSGMNLSIDGTQGFKVGTDYNLIRPNSTGFIFTLNEKYVTAAIHALANTTKLDVLSRPYILTSDNQEAQIMVGQSVPFITSSLINGDTGSTTNSISYQDIGIILDVTPHINPQGTVTMDVYPEISNMTDSTVEFSTGLSAPIFNKRFAQSRVVVRDGQTIVIGGLMQDRITKTTDKLPVLGDIPLLGIMFSHVVEKKTKTELLIFLTPHVAHQPEDLQDMAEQEKKGLKAVPHAVQPGAYEDHLEGLKRGAATQPTSEPDIIEYQPTPETAPTPNAPRGNGDMKDAANE